MKDKIIQITNTIDNDGNSETLGISDNGNLYRFIETGHIEKTGIGTKEYKQFWVVDIRKWELLIESPELLKTK